MSVKKYCYCENNCKYETLDKEEILTAIAQAVETGEVGNCDTGFITTIKTINGLPLRFFVGEQSEYAALTDKENLFAIITNDTTKEGLLEAIALLRTDLNELTERTSKLINEQNERTNNLINDIGNGKINAFSLESNNFIAENSDFNDYIYFGNYACVDNNTFFTLNNRPPNASAGSLKVISGTGGKVDVNTATYLYLLQIYISFTGTIHIRTMMRELGVWTFGEWWQFAGEGSKASIVKRTTDTLLDYPAGTEYVEVSLEPNTIYVIGGIGGATDNLGTYTLFVTAVYGRTLVSRSTRNHLSRYFKYENGKLYRCSTNGYDESNYNTLHEQYWCACISSL